MRITATRRLRMIVGRENEAAWFDLQPLTAHNCGVVGIFFSQLYWCRAVVLYSTLTVMWHVNTCNFMECPS